MKVEIIKARNGYVIQYMLDGKLEIILCGTFDETVELLRGLYRERTIPNENEPIN